MVIRKTVHFAALLVTLIGCAGQAPAASSAPSAAAEAEAVPEAATPPPAPSDTPAAPPAPAADQAPADSARPAHWGYAGPEAPSHWAELSPAYAACASEQGQSPVDLPSKAKLAKGKWRMDYGKTALAIAHHEHVHDIVDNGHTIQVTVDEGSTLTTSRDTYKLLQFHFHTPSENTVDGKHYPMEAHFVHQAQDGSFAVLAVFFEEGKANPNLAKLIAHFPAKGSSELLRDEQLDLKAHLPNDRSAYAFVGSFTTPPCTPGVEWLVLKTPIKAGADQFGAFAERLNQNNRPPQPLAARDVQMAKLGGKAQ